MLPIFGVLLIVTAVLVSPLSAEKCTKNSECPKEQCCMLGATRYAIPNCMPYQQKNEICRVNADTITTNLTYPDNSVLELTAISYILCPCTEGTSCDPKRGICT